MKALTLTQPWASLVVLGEKSIETRSWKTSYRGPLAIHAAKKAAPLEEWPAGAADELWRPIIGVPPPVEPDDIRLALPKGYIVGTVELVSIRQVHGYTDQGPILGWPDREESGSSIGDLGKYVNATHPWEQELAFGDYSPGRYAWLLRNPEAWENPVPARGALGLWECDLLTDGGLK